MLLPTLVVCLHCRPDPAGSARYFGPQKTLAYEARLGAVLFEHYCAVCHGAAGKGDGFNAYNLSPRPRDLSNSDFQQSVDDRRLADILRYGGTLRGGSPNMPAWGGTLDDRQIRRLVMYIRQLDETLPPGGGDSSAASAGRADAH